MNLNFSIPWVDSTLLQYMKQIDLNNYYTNVPERGIIHCQICKLSIAKNNVFEHAMSKRHKYNKLLFSIAQDRSLNEEIDFIVLNIDRLQCRYCPGLRINSDKDDLVINHLQDPRHITNRQHHLDRLSVGIRNNADVEYNLLKPLDSLINCVNKHKKQTKQSVKEIVMRSSLLEDSKQTEQLRNIDQTNTPQYSGFSRVSAREKEKELAERSTIGEDGPCLCSFCVLSLAKGIDFMCIRPDCKKNKRLMLPLMKSIGQESEARIFTSKDNNTPMPEPAQPIKYRTTDEIAKNIRKTDYIGQNNLPRCSAVTSIAEVEVDEARWIELLDHTSIGESGNAKCTTCLVDIPNDPHHIDQHVNCKKHKKVMEDEKELPDFISIVKSGICSCTICLIQFPNNYNCISDHINSKKHKNEVKIETELPDFITRVKSGICGCTICLIELPNNYNCISDHINSKKHKEAVKIETELPDFISIVKSGICSCTICLIEFPNNYNCISDHIKSKKHKKAVKIEIELPDCITRVKSGICSCTICLIEFPNNYNCISDHINSKKHKKAVKIETELPDFISSVKNGKRRCRTCLIEFPNTCSSINDHIDSKGHKKVTLQSMQSTSNNSKTKGVAQHSIGKRLKAQAFIPKDNCAPTPVPRQLLKSHKTQEIMTNVRETDNIGQNSLPQCSAALSDKELQSRIELPDCMSIADNGAYICTPCGTEVPKTTSNITQHIDGKRHKQKLIEIKESTGQKLQLQEPSRETETPAPAIDSTAESSSYMCISCLISIPNDKVSIKEHNECKKHRQKVLELKIGVQNAVYFQEKNSLDSISRVGCHYVCKTCRIFLPEHSLITDHVNSTEHKNNIPKTPAFSSSTDTRDLNAHVLSKHKDSGSVYVIAIDDVRACKICHKVILTPTDIHVRTKKHQAMMQKVNERLIGYEDNEKLWVCKICKILFPKSNPLIAHIFSSKHIRNMQAL